MLQKRKVDSDCCFLTKSGHQNIWSLVGIWGSQLGLDLTLMTALFGVPPPALLLTKFKADFVVSDFIEVELACIPLAFLMDQGRSEPLS